MELDLSQPLAEQGFNKVSLSYTRLWQDFTNSFAKTKYTKQQLEHQAILNLSYRLTANLSLTSLYKYENATTCRIIFVGSGCKTKFCALALELSCCQYFG